MSRTRDLGPIGKSNTDIDDAVSLSASSELLVPAITTSTAYIPVLSLTTPNLQQGIYRIGWRMSGDVAADDIEWQVRQDTAIILATAYGPRARTKTVFGTWFVEKTLSGVVLFELDHLSQGGASVTTLTAQIYVQKIG